MRLLVVAALVAACSHPSSSTAPTSGSWKGPDVLAHVPADTPYMFALLEPPSEAVRKKMPGNMDVLVIPALKESAAVPLDKRIGLDPPKRALLGIMDAMRGTDPTRWWENLGFANNGHWVLYGMGIWPVLRIEVGDPNKLRAILGEAVKTLAMPDLQQKESTGVSYWVASKFGVSAIVSVTDHEVVAALLPSQSLAATVPVVLGQKAVEHNLRDSGEIADLMARYHLVPATIGVLDTRRVIAALERRDDLSTTSVFTAPACHADYDRMAAVIPRIVLGYRQLDTQGFMASLAFETSPEIAKQLAALHTAMPAAPDPAHAMLSLVVAADVDAGVATLRGWLQGLADRPFQCEQLAILKMVIAGALEETKNLIPPELKGLRGGELVVEEATESPPGGAGYLLVAGDQIAIALGQALQKIPGIGGSLSIAPDGQPLELPVGMLGIPGLTSAHLAMHTSRAALAIGPRSKTDVTAALAAPNASRSPLMAFNWDIAKFIRQVPSVLKEDNRNNLAAIATMTSTLDVRDDTVAIDIGGTWVK
ncbi:MAG TPA: hypothetical protein VFQ65_09115 [Kofleriaceae bacterium]|nr:hypothetical protein [Kofleriaceae bacterium]